MAANEIAERIAASAWVRLGPSEGVGPNLDGTPSDPAKLGIRSLVGFNATLYARANIASQPYVFALVLDREMSRRETTVIGQAVFTQDDAQRSEYPDIANIDFNPGNSFTPYIEPFHTDWMGRPIGSAGNADWFPFGLGDNIAVAEPFDLDVYNAIAIMIPPSSFEDPGDTRAMAIDVSLLVLKHPKTDGAIPVVLSLPNPLG